VDERQLPPAAQARPGQARQAGTWTSSLTVGEFAGLRSIGFEPVGQVMGSTVHNLGWRYGSSIDFGYRAYIDTLYRARHAAMSRMATECAALGATYARVLTGTPADALPHGSVTVEHERGLGDRLRGRDGHPTRVVVRLGERTLSLAGGGRPVAEIHHEVRGVVLSRDQVPLDVWVETPARGLVAQADADARAAAALRRLVVGGT
jgi:hypothetical protein